jgi:hypothetical protein
MENWRRFGAVTVGSAILVVSAHANCPIGECDYLDPQYQAASDAYAKCIGPLSDAFDHAMDRLAVLYPKFGIAWQTQQVEMKSAAADPSNTRVSADTAEAHRRFEDRILRTAEPEALRAYNLWKLKTNHEAERCGPLPLPPRKQP